MAKKAKKKIETASVPKVPNLASLRGLFPEGLAATVLTC